MIAVVQRVSRARVTVAGEIVGEIGAGVLALVGVLHEDGVAEADLLARKIAELRIFPDAEGRMNRSALDAGLAALVVSQFTLCADLRRGRRPGFDPAARPDQAEALVARVISRLGEAGLAVATGRFGASMSVELVNEGPATFVLDTRTWKPAN